MLLGLFTRPAAFVMAGEMAVAYWMAHAPHSLFPLHNGGESAVLFCFVFLYLVFAGPGAWSLDAAPTGVRPAGKPRHAGRDALSLARTS